MEEVFFLSVRARWGHLLSQLRCNFDVKDFNLPSPFYYELLLWWSEFRDTFAEEKDQKTALFGTIKK